MVRLYVSTYDDNGIIRYAIYDDRNGEHHVFTADFKPVVFDTEEEANSRLASYEAERERENAAIPFTLEEAESTLMRSIRI